MVCWTSFSGFSFKVGVVKVSKLQEETAFEFKGKLKGKADDSLRKKKKNWLFSSSTHTSHPQSTLHNPANSRYPEKSEFKKKRQQIRGFGIRNYVVGH
jgi:hypothetical protein